MSKASETIRRKLFVLRATNTLTQEEMAARTGTTRARYSLIETGKARGGFKFWNTLQKEFNIPDSEMWELMKVEKRNAENLGGAGSN